jgi:hypothetical protein
VKVLRDTAAFDGTQFEEEYLNMACLQHKNIVRLVGYCHETGPRCVRAHDGGMILDDRTKMVICLEYMHNGNLDRFISGMDMIQETKVFSYNMVAM